MNNSLLKVANLNAFYGKAHILFDVNLEVRKGEVVALVGRNGAGKSTTMKAIMGLLDRASSEVEFNGTKISGWPSFKVARLGIGFVPEDRRIFTDLTVEENLDIGRRPPRIGSPAWTPEALYRLFPNLGAMNKRLGGQMSGGEQQMLTVARTLMGNPELILLDEPSEGIAPVIVEQMANMIIELKKQGLTVLLSEQNTHFAHLVSDRVYVLEKGQVKFEGTMEALMANEAVRQEYLEV
jgi:branched-chain amino acid transport system ATP-binding protein